MASVIGREAAQALTRGSTQAATKQAAQAVAKQAAKQSLKTALKESIQMAINHSKIFAKNAKLLGSKVAKTEPFQLASKAADASAEFVKKYPKLVVGGLAVGAVAALVLDNFMKKNDKVYKIIKILNENAGGVFGIGSKKYLKVYYSGDDELLVNDPVVLDNTNSITTSDGTYTIYKSGIDNGVRFVLLETDDEVPNITTEGSSGDLIYKTSFESQLKATLEDLGGETAGFLDKVLPDIPDEYKTYIYLFIALVVVVLFYNYVFIPLSYVFKLFTPSTTTPSTTTPSTT